MNQEEAFLQDILEHPADDGPRLVFADWLEERGAPEDRARAEFIRVQFALRDLPADDPRRQQLEERERDLRVAHEAAWTAPLRRLPLEWKRDYGAVGPSWEFRRGFVEKVAVEAEAFLRIADALFRLAPVQEVRLSYDSQARRASQPSALVRLANSPHLERLTALELEAIRPLEHEVQALAGSPHLTRLEALCLTREILTAEWLPHWWKAPFLPRVATLRLRGAAPSNGLGISELLQSPAVAGLQTLDLSDTGVTTAEMWAVASSPHLDRLATLRLARNPLDTRYLSYLYQRPPRGRPGLRTLDLSSCGLDAAAIRLMAESSLAHGLETLDLAHNRLGDAGVQALAESPHLGGLRRLNLNANQVGRAGVRAVANARSLGGLASLHLRTNRLGDGLADLAGAPGLGGLTALRVSNNHIKPAVVAAFAADPPGRLALLDLAWNPLDDDAIRALAASPGLAGLAALDLGYSQLGDGAAAALADSPHLGNLAALNLGTNRIGDSGTRALAASACLPRLRALNLAYNRIGEEGVRTLAASPLFRRLEALNLAGNEASPENLAELRRQFRGHLGG
jgi:uncharacterized protein (TIGR02996 family)